MYNISCDWPKTGVKSFVDVLAFLRNFSSTQVHKENMFFSTKKQIFRLRRIQQRRKKNRNKISNNDFGILEAREPVGQMSGTPPSKKKKQQFVLQIATIMGQIVTIVRAQIYIGRYGQVLGYIGTIQRSRVDGWYLYIYNII